VKQAQRTLALWIFIVLLSLLAVHFFNTKPTLSKNISFSELMDAVKNKGVEEVAIQDGEYVGKFKPDYREGVTFSAVGPEGSEKVIELLTAGDAKVEFKKRAETPVWQQIAISWLPMILLFVFFFFFMRQIQLGGGKALSFGKSKARLLSENQKRMTFADVAGCDEAKDELQEIIEFLKDPHKFTKLGGRIPKGVLLMGPPGTGKTLLARAI
jgi:cell division protease FtsH